MPSTPPLNRHYLTATTWRRDDFGRTKRSGIDRNLPVPLVKVGSRVAGYNSRYLLATESLATSVRHCDEVGYYLRSTMAHHIHISPPLVPCPKNQRVRPRAKAHSGKEGSLQAKESHKPKWNTQRVTYRRALLAAPRASLQVITTYRYHGPTYSLVRLKARMDIDSAKGCVHVVDPG